MNKNKIIYYLCISLLMLGFGVVIAIIINSFGNKYETNEAKTMKNALVILDENRSSNKKSYEISFVQDVEYEEKKDTDLEIINYKAHYKSNGSFVLSYEVADSKKIDLSNGFKSFLDDGVGFMSGNQSEIHIIQNEEIDKATNEKTRSENYNYTLGNKFVIDNRETIKVLSETMYHNNLDDNKKNYSFYGKINKETLMSCFESERFNEALNRMLFIDFWSDVNNLMNYLQKIFKEVNYNDSESVYKLIETMNINVEEANDAINLYFELDLDDSFKNEKNNYKNILVNLRINKESKNVDYFKFDLSNYLFSILKTDPSNSGVFSSNVNDYIIQGKILNDTLNNKEEANVSYKEYDESNKFDFIDDFVQDALPVHEDIY